MAQSDPTSPKKILNVAKRRDKSHINPSQEALPYVCNVTGLDDGVSGLTTGRFSMDDGGMVNNVLDCLEELATSQVGVTASSSKKTVGLTQKHDERNVNNSVGKTTPIQTLDSPSPPPPPPGIDQIPNLRIELSRHLHTQKISAFLLQSVPGLRMPTFERWLLDSKLEETDRLHSIMKDLTDNPSSRLPCNLKLTKSEKKYCRATVHQKSKHGEANIQQSRESAREEKDHRLLLGAGKRIRSLISCEDDHCGYIGDYIRHLDRDPVLPYQVMENDSSCDRLLKEITATMASKSEEELNPQHSQKAREIVRDLCHRTSEACNELHHLEQRLGKYQKFGWDATASASGKGSTKKKMKKCSGGSRGCNIDKIHVEWHTEDKASTSLCRHQLCHLVYVPKKRKHSRSSSTAAIASAAEDAQNDYNSQSQRKPKPFVVKLNASHYHKLRKMFDTTHQLSNTSTACLSRRKEQLMHAFHAILFAAVIRYSSLSGGQLLNDWRGGGMQGAVHEEFFDCLSKRFGASSGMECFASPFNSTLSQFFSLFPSPDIDGHFGSRGNFFCPSSSSDFLHPGWYELNPPFSPGVMKKMADRIGELLEIQSKRRLNTVFIVVIPTVQSISNNGHSVVKAARKTNKKKRKRQHSSDDEDSKDHATDTSLMSTLHHAASPSFHQLINSPYCESHFVLPAREHGYIEGGQHLRPTKFKESQYNTSVIVLRNKGSTSAGCSKAFEKNIREAFASRHATEVENRKAASKRKAN